MSKIPMLAALVAVPTDIRAKVPAPQPADWWSRSFEERQKKIIAKCYVLHIMRVKAINGNQ